MIFNPKISSLEERTDPAMLSMDELHGILTTYEMRTKPDYPMKGETTFKISKKKIHKHKTNPDCNSDDEEEAHFTKGLQRGTYKYKGKLPFKCFNCRDIGHFASKCPY